MLNLFENKLLDLNQRRVEAPSIWHKMLLRWGRKRYARIFKNHSDRKKLSYLFWGRNGGYHHARDQFDRSYNDWIRYYGDFHCWAGEIISTQSCVLELGCSCGQWAHRLNLEDVCSYVGIDINKQSIAYARNVFKRSSQFEFRAMDIRDFCDYKKFDIVLSCQTFFFLENSAVIEIFNRVPSGAKILFQEPINGNDQDRNEESVSLIGKSSLVGFSHPYHALCRETGLTIIKEKRILGHKESPQTRLLVLAKKESHDY